MNLKRALRKFAFGISFIMTYSMLLVWLGSYVVSLVHNGILWWGPIIRGLAPVVVWAHQILTKRRERYLRQLMNNQLGF
jgi:hypothetical protein